MNSERWERLQLLFEEVLAQPALARKAFIDSACSGEADLRDELLSLLAVHERRGEIATPRAWLDSLAEPEAPQFRSGEQVAGRYQIRGLLGRGGMGEVYEAWDQELSIPVALKTLHVEAGAEALQRLKREGLLARSVSHPNVCRVYDLGRHGEGWETAWFLTMEVLRGETLADRLQAHGRFPTERALPIAEQMASGLGAAHQAGVVHRDFKTANVMLVRGDAGEQAVVTDFGIARAPEATRPRGEPQRFGTPAYMAPEQVCGGPVGPAADIYALGLVLYEMVTGWLPFMGGSAHEVARHRLEEDPPPPRSVAPELDKRWDAVILRCLDRDPRRRYTLAQDVAEDLRGRAPATMGPLDVIPRARHTLPAERDAFVGREHEIEELGRHLASEAHLVTLLGPGGVGKTRLAVRYGWQTLSEWPGGVWFCDLTEARSLHGILSAVAGPLGVQLARGDPIEQLRRAIQGRGRCLVILDNFEQVADLALATVGGWMRGAREARFVVTSRERLGLGEEEHVQAVEPLPPGTGMELFATRARWLRPGLALAGEEMEAAREIVRLVDGIPLAIELAAARIRVMSTAQIAARMRMRFQLLTGGRSARHETLAAAIDGSWELLSPWEKAAWEQCAVFEGGFTFEAAEGVLDLKAWPEAPGAVDVIQSLVDKSLLRTWLPRMEPQEGVPETRLGMYVSLQEYARLKLREEGAIARGESGSPAAWAAEERHGRWYARYGTEDHIDGLDRHGGVTRRHALGREAENLVAACHRAVDRGDSETALAAYRAAAQFYFMRGPLEMVVKLGGEVLACMAAPEDRARVLFALGRAELFCGRMEEAEAHLEDALAIHRQLGDRCNQGVVRGTLALLMTQQGRMKEAYDNYSHELAIDRELGNQVREGTALLNLGDWHRRQSQMEEARAHFEASLALCRRVGNRLVEGMLLTNLGQLHRGQGRRKEALAHLEAGLAVGREVGSRLTEGNALNSLGLVYFALGDLQAADDHFQAALTIHRETGNRFLEGLAIGNLGLVHFEQGHIEEASVQYGAALAIFREVGNPFCEGEMLADLGTLHLRQGRVAEAREALDQGESVLRRAGGSLELGTLLCARAELEHRTGDLGAARAALGEAEAIAARVGERPELESRLSKLRPMLA